MFKNPHFWKEKNWLSNLLIPLSWIWTWIGHFRLRQYACKKISVPVICVGNAVMGGAGKTPTVLALVSLLKKMGYVPHILSRGYGAYIRDVISVDPSRHTFIQVGDEPLLLAREAPTWAGPNRILSAQTAVVNGATILIMDDGLQNNMIYKDLNFLVVDGIQGFGNGRVFPAGPLREPLIECFQRIQATIFVGEKDEEKDYSILSDSRQFHARIEAERTPNFQKVIGFCGLGCPEKFEQTLIAQGYDVCKFVIFADHHPYTIPDMIQLLKLRDELKAALITTTKDWLRLPQSYRTMVEVLPITLKFLDEKSVITFLNHHLNADANRGEQEVKNEQ